MSVSVPDPKVYEYVLNGLKIAAYRTTCDNLFASCIYQHFKDKDVEEEAPRLIKAWLYLNELSYCVAYKEPYKEKDSLFPYIRINEYHKVEAIQLYSFVKCLWYNTSISSIKAKQSFTRGPVENIPALTKQQMNDFNLLSKWRITMLEQIVETQPAYHRLAWSDGIPESVKKLPGSIHPMWERYSEEEKKYYTEASEVALITAKEIAEKVKAITPPTKAIYYRGFVFESIGQIISESI